MKVMNVLLKYTQTSPSLLSSQPAQQRQWQRPAAQQPVLRQLRQAAGGVRGTAPGTSSSNEAAAPAIPSDALQAELQHTAVAAAPPAASSVDPLEQLLHELLAAEGAGDPHSIINLYVAEQLQLQHTAVAATASAAVAAVPAAAAPASAAPHAGPQHAAQLQQRAVPAADNAQLARQGGHSPLALEPVEPEVQAAAPEVHMALMQQAAAAGIEEALPPDLAKELLPLKEQPSLKLQPSESAPSTARHRRSSSLMLPPQLDLAAAAEPAEWSIGAFGPGGAELPATSPDLGQPAGMPAAVLQPPVHQQATQRQQSAPAADSVPLEQQQGGSKQLYVQQWLQRSAAEVAAPESVPAGSSAGYSEDPNQASAQQETLSSLASPAADMAPPTVPTGTAANAERLSPSAAAIAAAAAAASPDAAAAAAPSRASVASRSVSAVTSMRRPGAPEPPSSSSQLDGSSCPPSRIPDAAAATGWAAVAAPVALAAQPEEPQAAADDRSLGSSSWDGSSAAGSELPAALSFSQLQAVGVVDATVMLPTAGAEHVAAAAAGTVDERRCDSPCSSVSPRSDALDPAGNAAPPACPAEASPLAAGAGASAVAAVPAGPQRSSAPSSQAYSSDFDSDFEDAEISYGDLGASRSPAPLAAAATTAASMGAGAAEPMPPAAAAAEDGSRPSSPHLLPPAMWQAGGGSPPGSAGSQQRPRSPHHAALDDRYPGSHPGSPPSSAGSPALQLPVPGATYSRPLSPASRGGSPRASGDGGVTSRPTSPGSAAAAARTAQQAQQAAAAAVADALAMPQELEQEDTVIVYSPAGSSSSGKSSGSHGGQAGSPYSLVQFGIESASVAAAEEAALAAATGPGAAAGAPPAAAVGSPPGTPVVASPGEDYGSCPGSARVDDDTVVQTEEHNRAYLQEVLEYFGRERAEAFAAGAAPYPLELDGYLAIERRRPACGDPQHIWNKLLFDAANEALAAHYAQAVRSLTGRLAPQVALLDPALLDRHVTQRVLRWAALGGSMGSGGIAAVGGGGVGDLSAMLAEDAAEEERALGQLVEALHAELAAAASRAASPEPVAAAAVASPGAPAGAWQAT
ncbi:hypothetical protein COHA_004062 [Chlorella ohadii]|uniref:Uncharacterized protein n=1 Tax=Chlorella ohadii TaxID=2649997 RepID=A0AAD5DTX1_9CHLO|nr:hypothetical protein COHA_004062 [Chlorella ohadii]